MCTTESSDLLRSALFLVFNLVNSTCASALSKMGSKKKSALIFVLCRYAFLLPRDVSEQEDVLSVCVAILEHFKKYFTSEMYQVGISKLFFRAGQVLPISDVTSSFASEKLTMLFSSPAGWLLDAHTICHLPCMLELLTYCRCAVVLDAYLSHLSVRL